MLNVVRYEFNKYLTVFALHLFIPVYNLKLDYCIGYMQANENYFM